MSSSKRTALGEMFIPSPFYKLFVGNHRIAQITQGTRIKTITVCLLHGRGQSGVDVNDFGFINVDSNK
ncbi:MAG: hypothetical protein RL631_2233 [Pseudomonadota bacterium]